MLRWLSSSGKITDSTFLAEHCRARRRDAPKQGLRRRREPGAAKRYGSVVPEPELRGTGTLPQTSRCEPDFGRLPDNSDRTSCWRCFWHDHHPATERIPWFAVPGAPMFAKSLKTQDLRPGESPRNTACGSSGRSTTSVFRVFHTRNSPHLPSSRESLSMAEFPCARIPRRHFPGK